MILIYDACTCSVLFQASDDADLGAAIERTVASFDLGDPRYLMAVRVEHEGGYVRDRQHGEVLFAGVCTAPGPMRPYEVHLMRAAA